ncbi:MAG: SDR family oxidoreductase, partial [Proteobacteria bacterium]|nr:SDR family oxidoreductase [Pseudomonadota bacterium]
DSSMINDSSYVGFFNEGLPHGNGRLERNLNNEGNLLQLIYDGEWNNGLRDGTGEEINTERTPYFFSYTISKTGLHILTKTTAMKLAPKIRVNAIAPGPVFKNIRQTQKHFNKQSKNTLLGKSVKIEDICETAYLLANSKTITGQVIAVDSGQSLNWKTPDIIGTNE